MVNELPCLPSLASCLMTSSRVKGLVKPLLEEGAEICKLVVYRGANEALLGILLEPWDEKQLHQCKRIRVSHLGDITEMFQTDV
jgi:hypothetical protein